MSNLVSAQPCRIAAVILALAAFCTLSVAQTFTDPGFTAETAYTASKFNTIGFVFAPDGRIFTWEKPGTVSIIKNGIRLTTPFLDISTRVNVVGDRGLVGFALDPNFATNGYVYVTYVYEPNGNPSDTAPKTSRLSRFQADPANPDRALANSETIILGSLSTAPCSNYPAGSDCIADDSTSHTIDSLRFGVDGKLFLTVGDGASFTFADVNAFRAQDLNSYNGKILRINSDGTGPSDNPYFDGNPNSIKSKVFSYGLRNPFSFTFKPDTTDIYVGHVGWNKWEAIVRGRAENFGWPCFEGNDPNPDYQSAFADRCALLPASIVTFPLYTYSHNGAGAAVTAGTFFNSSIYPAKYQGSLLFGDYVLNFIKRMVFDSSGNLSTVETFATGVASPVHMEQGPDGFLYYLTVATGEIKRLRYSASLNPTAVANFTRPISSDPYTIAFNSAGSTDPAASPLTYYWEFGDGSTSTAANPVYTYTATGIQTFKARLTVTNVAGLAGSVQLDVLVGSRPPVATITAPLDGTRANIGDVITFTGTASDPDETLPASSMSWLVLLHHNDHVHPGVTATGPTGSFVIENHGTTGETYFYEVTLTVTDSTGITDTKRVNVIPQTSTSTLPVPWLGQEVGDVGLPGLAGFATGTFTITGSGSDITGFNDGFYFVYQKLVGDGAISGRIASVVNTAPGAKAGLMMRASLAGNAAHALISASPIEGIAFERRDNTAYGTNLVSGGYFATPRWLKMVRSGTTLSGYQSADGITWTLVSTATTVGLPSEVYVGMAVTANTNLALTTSVIDNVSVTTAVVNKPPTVSITAPLGGATYQAPANITVAANAADSDGTITKVEFYRDGILQQTTTAAPYQVTLSGLAAGTYSLTAIAYDNSGAFTTSLPVSVTVSPAPGALPAPWLSQGVGDFGLPGLATFASNIFTISGSGSDIVASNDGFYFVYQKLVGNGTIVARVASVQKTAAGAKAGLMMRESLVGNASYAMISSSPVKGIGFQRRDKAGFGTNLVSGGYFAIPRWLKLVRSGNTLTGYHSVDGVKWTQVSSATSVVLPSEVFVGVVVTSATKTALSKAVVDNVTITKQ